MKVYIQKLQSHRSMKFSGTVSALLRKLDINPETVIVTCDGKLVTEDDKLRDSSRVEILQVVSGG